MPLRNRRPTFVLSSAAVLVLILLCVVHARFAMHAYLKNMNRAVALVWGHASKVNGDIFSLIK